MLLSYYWKYGACLSHCRWQNELHTPVQNLNIGKVVLEIDKTCGGHKIDIDLGTIVSKTIAVLDLDTLKPTYFKEEDGGITIW